MSSEASETADGKSLCVCVCVCCIDFLLLCNKLPQSHLVASNNTHLLSHSFCGLGVYVLVGGLICSGSHQTGIPSDSGASSRSLVAGGAHVLAVVWLRFQVSFLAVDWGPFSDPQGCPHVPAPRPITSRMAAASSGPQERVLATNSANHPSEPPLTETAGVDNYSDPAATIC